MAAMQLALVLPAACGGHSTAMTDNRTSIVGATAMVGPELRPLADSVITLSEGRIEAVGTKTDTPVPEGATVIDASGKTLVPGFIDAHVHIGFSDPHDVLAGGITTARDLAWPPGVIVDLAERSRKESFEGPEIFAAGPMITVPGGYPTRAGWAPEGTGLPIRGPAAARDAVRDLANEGAAVIKVALNRQAGPVLDEAELKAIVSEAHERGLKVTGHVYGMGSLTEALSAHMDELAHMLMSTERLPEQTIDTMVRQGMAVVPTLAIRSGRDRRIAISNLRRFLGAGGRVVYGTDLGNAGVRPGIDPTEVRLMARAGMSPLEILASATSGSAGWLGLDDRGMIAPGMRADLVALDTENIDKASDLAKVDDVWRGGRRVTSAR